nr:DUF2800 domain-containing protein [uncultured Acetatifactor sp.]
MAKKSEEKKHALLSASSAKKWLNCTLSARLEEAIPDRGSEYAAEGTLAHEICELKLAKQFTDKNMTDRTYKNRLGKLMKEPLYAKEMDGFTDAYVDYITGIAYGFPSAPYMAVEKRVDYSPWAPEGFGTCDCILIHGEAMHVCDFKYGKGKAVGSFENPQLMLYALGAWNAFRMIYPVKTVTLHVIQPRIDNTSSWEVPLEALLRWGEETVKPRALEAYRGDGECVQGKWCDDCFCRMSATCRARAEANTALMAEAEDPSAPGDAMMRLPPRLDNGEVGALLKRAQFLKSWVNKLEAYAQGEILAGREVPGWKLVEGRSTRTIRDIDAVYKELHEAGYPEAALYRMQPLPLSELDKILEKDHKVILEKYIVKPPGKPTLVPEDDKRPAISSASIAEGAFGGENTYKGGE